MLEAPSRGCGGVIGNSTLLAIASGLALALAFPQPGWAWIAWVALVPLLRAIDGRRVRHAFLLGWLSSAVFHGATLYWVAVPITRFADLPFAVGAALAALLAAVLGLYGGVFAAALRFVERRCGIDPVLLAASLWTMLEWCRAAWLFPFPWNPLGASQARSGAILQIVEWTGVYGVSGLIVLVNVALDRALFGAGRGSFRDAIRLSVVTGLLGAVLVGGAWRKSEVRSQLESGEPLLRVGLVQPAFEPMAKSDPAEARRFLEQLVGLSRLVETQGAGLVVWPEAAGPFGLDEVREATRDLTKPLLFGAPAVLRAPLGRGEVVSTVNRAWLLDASRGSEAFYDKMVLVPFGEYVPFPEALFFVERFVPGTSDIVAGSSPTVFSLGQTRFSVLICYEAIFPGLARRRVADGADFLVNLTNDAWFGNTSAPHQHLALAAIRAVETRRPLVRVANTGISAIIDPDGEMRGRTRLFEAATRVLEVRGLEEQTFYVRHGDVFAGVASLVATLLLMYAGSGTPTTTDVEPIRAGT